MMPFSSRSSTRLRLATNPYLVVWVLLCAILVWSLPTIADIWRWAGFGVAFVTTLLVMEWNNRASLLRVRSRMTSSSFLFLLTLFPQLHSFGTPLLVMLGGLVTYMLLCHTYQANRPEGYVFHAFLLLSLGSFAYPPLVFLSVALWVYLIVFLRAFTVRTFFASVFGLLLPYVYAFGYMLWKGNVEEMLAVGLSHFVPQIPHYDHLPWWQVSAYAYVWLLAIPAIVHFLRDMAAEKRRTVMFFGMLIAQTLLLLLILPLQVQAFDMLFPLLLVSLSPLLAHQHALAKGRGTNIWFAVSIGLGLVLALCNYFNVWTLFSTFL